MLYFGCHRTGMLGGPGSIICLKIFFPPVLPPQYLGRQLPSNVFGVWSNQGYCSCRLYDGMICWARSLGPNNFLIKSTSYLSSCVPIPSWAVSDFFFLNLAKPCGMCDISFPNRDWTWAPCTGRQSSNHWTAREVLGLFQICLCSPSASHFSLQNIPRESMRVSEMVPPKLVCLQN